MTHFIFVFVCFFFYNFAFLTINNTVMLPTVLLSVLMTGIYIPQSTLGDVTYDTVIYISYSNLLYIQVFNVIN